MQQNNYSKWPGTLWLTEADVEKVGAKIEPNMTAQNCFINFGITYDFFHEVFNRDSLDDKGFTLIACVGYDFNFPNALWHRGTMQMVFGDGFVNNAYNSDELCGLEGLFGNYASALDIVAHELTHGLLDQPGYGLNYNGQSGALNESVADVIGTMVMQWHKKQNVHQASWLVGEDLLKPGVNGVAMRSLKAPGTAYDIPGVGKDPQPGHMNQYAEGTALSKYEDSDNGGVHINSGEYHPGLCCLKFCVSLTAPPQQVFPATHFTLLRWHWVGTRGIEQVRFGSRPSFTVTCGARLRSKTLHV